MPRLRREGEPVTPTVYCCKCLKPYDDEVGNCPVCGTPPCED